MSQRNVCVFFNTPAGCRRGANCKGRHERHKRGVNAPSSSDPPAPAPAPAPATLAPSGSSNPRPLNVPNGICRFFWNNGNCRFTDCRFRHVRQSDPASSTPAPAPTPPATRLQSPPASTAPQPLTVTAPLRAAGARYQLHNVFLLPNYKFTHPATINRFVNILASCSVANEWVIIFC